VLLVSEDLDELLLLADRIVVMSEGRVVFDVPARQADRRELGAFMGGKAPSHVVMPAMITAEDSAVARGAPAPVLVVPA